MLLQPLGEMSLAGDEGTAGSSTLFGVTVEWVLSSCERAALEANHDRFRFQADAPDFFHAMLDLFFQSENIGGCGSAASDDRERVFGGNANAPKAKSFGEA